MTNEAPTGLPARALVSLLFLSVPVPACIRWLWAVRGEGRTWGAQGDVGAGSLLGRGHVTLVEAQFWAGAHRTLTGWLPG